MSLSEQKHVLNVFGRTSTRLLFKSTSERNSEIRVCKVRITWTGDHDRTNLLTGVLCEAAAYGLRDSPKLWSGLYYTSEQTTLVNSCECETRQPKKKENVEINIYIWRAKKTKRKSCQYTTDRCKNGLVIIWMFSKIFPFAAACTLQNQPNLPKEKDDECMAAATNDALVL